MYIPDGDLPAAGASVSTGSGAAAGASVWTVTGSGAAVGSVFSSGFTSSPAGSVVGAGSAVKVHARVRSPNALLTAGFSLLEHLDAIALWIERTVGGCGLCELGGRFGRLRLLGLGLLNLGLLDLRLLSLGLLNLGLLELRLLSLGILGLGILSLGLLGLGFLGFGLLGLGLFGLGLFGLVLGRWLRMCNFGDLAPEEALEPLRDAVKGSESWWECRFLASPSLAEEVLRWLTYGHQAFLAERRGVGE